MCIAFLGFTVDSEKISAGREIMSLREFGQRGGLLRRPINR